MSMTIRAAVARGGTDTLSLETLRLDSPRPDEVLVRLVATGICHTDLSVLQNRFPMPLPMVLGHEGAGIIVEAGSESGRSPGEHVVLSFASCGKCASCSEDHPAYCENYPALNYAGRRCDGSPTITDEDGQPIGGAFFGQSSFAEYALVRGSDAVPVPDDVPLELLAGFGCGFITGAGTVMNVLKPRPGSSLLILGAGALGFAALFAARLAQCAEILVVDRIEGRLTLASELGATRTIDTSRQTLEEGLAEVQPLNYVIDTTGVPSLVAAAVARLARRGTCALLGGSSDRSLTVDMVGLIPGKVITGVVEGDADPQSLIPELVELFRAGQFPVDRLIRHFPFDNINEAMAAGHDGSVVKPVVVFGGVAAESP